MKPGKLHILTDVVVQHRFDAASLAAMAFRGGADVVQYREKNKTIQEMTGEVLRIMALPRRADQRVILNDHVMLAQHAQGVHLGAEDMHPREAREILGDTACIGATVHHLSELEALLGAPLDYIGVGPVFGTISKNTGLPPLGLEGLSALCAASPWPVIAIGSITPERTADVLAAGAYGVAVISAFCTANDPEKIAARFAEILA
jgi:thiamine-phosphate pyrophosphorylase